jgi:hypothetical protein
MNNTWKLDRDGSLANFYRYFYAKDTLPNNGCDYFWLLCLGFILMPFVWPAVLLNMWNDKITLRETTRYDINSETHVPYTYYSINSTGFIQTGLGILLNFLLIILGGLILSIFYKYHPSLSIFHIKSFILTMLLLYAIGLSCIGLAYYGGAYLLGLLIKIGPKRPETPEEWDAYYDKQEAKEKARREAYIYRQSHPGFFKMIGMRFMSYKEKNCPIIEWEETKKAE